MKTMISRTGFAFLMLGMPVYGQTAVGTTVATTVGTTAASAYSGKISGTVLDETGKAMAGAIVSLALELPATTKGVAPVSFRRHRALAISGKDGTFAAANLPAGLIKVCVQVPASDYIQSCGWPLAQTLVTLSAGQTVKLPAISLAKGFRLQIRVDDVQGALAKTAAAGAPSSGALVVGAFAANHMFVNAERTGQDATGYNYDVLLPFDLPLRLSVFSRALAMADSTGKAATGGGIVSAVTVASGTATLPVVKVSITGLAGK